MQSKIISLNLDEEVVHEIANFARRLNMTNLEYVKKGILYFNMLNKRNLSISQIRSNAIIGQQSPILSEMRDQKESHFIL